MSSVLRPVGPRRARIYWRRRMVAVLLLALLVVAVLLIVRGCSGPGGAPNPISSGSTGGSSSQSSTPDPATSSAGSSSGPSSGSASPSASTATSSASPSASVTTAPPVLLRCEDSAILVEMITDGSVFSVDSEVSMELWVTNVSATPCIRNLGTEMNRVVVRQGDLQVWSSTSCEGQGEAKDVTLLPSSTYMIPLIWDGRSNYAGCAATEPLAKAGDYEVSARNGEVTSRSVSFTLQ